MQQSYSSSLSFTQIKKRSEADFLAADAARCLLAEQREQANEPVLDTTADEIEIEITAPAPATCINPALLALMRAYRAKLPQADPLAVEKIKVERYLKKNGLSSTDLPEGFRGLDRDARGRVLGEIIGEKRDKDRAAKRLERLIAVGYPADYLSRPFHEQRRISAAVRSRRRRAKRAPTRAAGLARAIPSATINREWCADKLALLKAWTAGTGPVARKFRGREHDLVRAAAHYHAITAEFGRQPSHAALAGRIGCKRRTAQNRARVLVSLYAVGGPWHSKA